MVYMKLIGDKG